MALAGPHDIPTDRFPEPDLDPNWGSPNVTTLYAVIDRLDELSGAVEPHAYRFKTQQDAEAFAEHMADASVVRVTIEEEW